MLKKRVTLVRFFSFLYLVDFRVMICNFGLDRIKKGKPGYSTQLSKDLNITSN